MWRAETEIGSRERVREMGRERESENRDVDKTSRTCFAGEIVYKPNFRNHKYL